MPFVEDDHVNHAVSTDRADDPFAVWILQMGKRADADR